MAMLPRASAVSIENNFSRGLITEATAMNYPENSVSEADNCVFLKTGKVIRRWGVDFEENYETETYEEIGIMGEALDPSDYFDDLAVVEFEWNTVANDGNTVFTVVQVGDRLNFYEVDDDNEISSNRKSFTVNIGDFRVDTGAGDEGFAIANTPVTMTSGFGHLFVTHPLCNPFYVLYTQSTDTITSTAITIKVRDFDRIDDSLDLDERPAALTDKHKYNLYNQGWYVSAVNTGGTGNVLTYWDTSRADFPSNSDIWWTAKNSSAQFDSTWIERTSTGNTPAPNGHYIYTAFNVNRNSKAGGLTGVPEQLTNYRPSACTFFAGRVWYAGVPDADYHATIYFTKIIESKNDFGVCYQLSDPTKENQGYLFGNDGGTVTIAEMGTVYKMLALTTAVLIFASNGIWKISGPDGVFQATDYYVQKISSASIASPFSCVVAEGVPFWWDQAGIYSIQYDPTSKQELVVNISADTIQSLVTSIPGDNLQYVKGAYNNINKTIHWLYRDIEATNLAESFNYNRLLVLSLSTMSFSPQSISINTPVVSGILFTSKSNRDPLLNEEGSSVMKFLTLGLFGSEGQDAITFSQFNQSNYVDWTTYGGGGTDYSSYFITGYRIRGDLLKKFQSDYVVVISEQEEGASCLIQGVWDYSNSPDTGLFTSSQQIFKTNTTKDYSRRKLKMRGNGYSLQFKFRSVSNAPFTIIGWASSDTGTNIP